VEGLSKNPFMERFRAIVDEGVAQRRFRAPRDVRHLLVNFIGLCFVYYSNQYTLATSIGVDAGSARARSIRVEQATDLVLHGLLQAGK
ncbi:MAG: TetR/AcrR family transcriptional regulator, partial [Opitutaceae bacterium]